MRRLLTGDVPLLPLLSIFTKQDSLKSLVEGARPDQRITCLRRVLHQTI